MISLTRSILTLSVLVLGLKSTSVEAHAIWKRSFQLEQDLARSLAMEPEALCHELTEYSCFRYAHQYALGGHNAADRGQMHGQSAPSLTTAVAVERVVLAACTNRLNQDLALNQLDDRVFRFFELEVADEMIAPEAVEAQANDLYKRFLIRKPSSAEMAALLDLRQNVQPHVKNGFELAQIMCFTVGTHSEFLFY